MFKKRFFVIGAGIALTLLIIYLCSLVNFIFLPFVSLFSLLIVPLVISAFFYYPLRPLVRYLEKKRIKRIYSVLLIFLVGVLFIIGCSFWVVPTLSNQIQSFVEYAPRLSQDIVTLIRDLQGNEAIGKFIPESNEDTLSQISSYLDVAVDWISSNVSGMFGFISNFFTVMITFPVMLFFMLRDDQRVQPALLKWIPANFKAKGKVFLDEVDSALNNFIAGRVLVNLALCVLLYIGFLAIGLPSTLLLVIISFFLNFIPFIGAFLAGVPVALVALSESPTMMLLSIIIIVVAQVIQNNFLEPLIFGNQLNMHPFTVIVVVLIGGDLFGVVGMIICIPIYMTIKIVLRYIYEIILSKKMDNDEEEAKEEVLVETPQ